MENQNETQDAVVVEEKKDNKVVSWFKSHKDQIKAIGVDLGFIALGGGLIVLACAIAPKKADEKKESEEDENQDDFAVDDVVDTTAAESESTDEQ